MGYAHTLYPVSQDAAVDLQAAGLVRPVLLRMDRATGLPGAAPG